MKPLKYPEALESALHTLQEKQDDESLEKVMDALGDAYWYDRPLYVTCMEKETVLGKTSFVIAEAKGSFGRTIAVFTSKEHAEAFLAGSTKLKFKDLGYPAFIAVFQAQGADAIVINPDSADACELAGEGVLEIYDRAMEHEDDEETEDDEESES